MVVLCEKIVGGLRTEIIGGLHKEIIGRAPQRDSW